MRESARTSGSNGFNILYNYYVANHTFSAYWFGNMVCLHLSEGGGIDWRRRGGGGDGGGGDGGGKEGDGGGEDGGEGDGGEGGERGGGGEVVGGDGEGGGDGSELNEETEEKEKDDKEMEEEGNLLTVYSTVWSLPSGSSTW